MASLFDEIDASSQAVTEEVFGEAVRIEPRVASQYTERATDPTRPAKDVVAVVSFGIASDNFIGQRTGVRIDTSSKIALRTAEVWMSAASYAALGYEVQKQDAVVMTDQAGQPVYSVSRVTPDAGGVTLILTGET